LRNDIKKINEHLKLKDLKIVDLNSKITELTTEVRLLKDDKIENEIIKKDQAKRMDILEKKVNSLSISLSYLHIRRFLEYDTILIENEKWYSDKNEVNNAGYLDSS